MVTAMLQYYIDYNLEMSSSSLLIMLSMLGVLAIFLVPCGILSNKFGKAKTYALGLAIASAALVVVFAIPQGPNNWIFLLAAIAGMGFSAQWVCPHSMIPDVIEYDELMTGERREGVYYGMQATCTKVTGAIATAACGWGLELGKYIEPANGMTADMINQPDTALFSIRVMFAVIPAIFLLICIPLLMKYPITRESHAEVLKQLEEKRKQKDKK